MNILLDKCFPLMMENITGKFPEEILYETLNNSKMNIIKQIKHITIQITAKLSIWSFFWGRSL